MTNTTINGMHYSDTFLSLVQPGHRLRLYFNEGNPNNQIRHIRAIVDDDQVVYRVWSHGSWYYHVVWLYSFWLAWQDGVLRPAQQPRISIDA